MPKPSPKQIAYDMARHRAEIPAQFNTFADDVIPSDSTLQFEQRILRPSQFPVLDMGRGQVMTHKMMNAEVGLDGVNTPIAYPTVVYDPKTKRLTELGADAAFEHAMKTGEFRKFDNPDMAGAYAEGLYKKHWGQGDNMDALAAELQRQGVK